ncbi:hypothetical protein T4A_10727, partial [Trichinella pseudospiralis]
IIFNRVLLAANFFSAGIELAFAIPFGTIDYPQAIHRLSAGRWFESGSEDQNVSDKTVSPER